MQTLFVQQLPFIGQKTKFIYILMKPSLHFLNRIWDQTNRNHMPFFSNFIGKKILVGSILEKFCSYGGTMTRLF